MLLVLCLPAGLELSGKWYEMRLPLKYTCIQEDDLERKNCLPPGTTLHILNPPLVGKGTEKSHDNFNIPKLHTMHHYINSIISRSADRFITESPKRFHIDFAKNAYRATNKKNYLKQMTKWLEHQDACFRFSVYLQWTVKGYNS